MKKHSLSILGGGNLGTSLAKGLIYSKQYNKKDLLITEKRKLLASKNLWLAGGIALVLFSPFILWQTQHGFPILEYWMKYAKDKTFQASPLEFLWMHIDTLNRISFPVWALKQ